MSGWITLAVVNIAFWLMVIVASRRIRPLPPQERRRQNIIVAIGFAMILISAFVLSRSHDRQPAAEPAQGGALTPR